MHKLTPHKEVAVIRRNTQTTAYWREWFKINLDDLEYLGNYLLEKETHETSEALTLALIEYRCQREESKSAAN